MSINAFMAQGHGRSTDGSSNPYAGRMGRNRFNAVRPRRSFFISRSRKAPFL